MHTKRFFAILLALLLAAGTVTACGEQAVENTESQVLSDTAAETEPETEDIYTDYCSIDLGGRSVRISVSSNSADGMESSYLYIAGPEELTGELAKDNAYERNIFVEEMLNCKLEYEAIELGYDKVESHISKLVTAGDNSIDYFINDQYGLVACARKGQLLDVTDTSNFQEYYFDFDSDVYYREYMDGINVGNGIYMITGDYFIDTLRAAHSLYMNTKMYGEKYGDPYGVYKTVLEDKWTLDALYTIIDESYVDTNGDGASDADDNFGMVIATKNDLNSYWMLYYSTDSRVVDFDERGMPYPAENNLEKMVYVTDMLINIQYSQGIWKSEDVHDSLNIFVDDKAIFCVFQKLGAMELEHVRNFEGTGVVPYPMSDENQDGYRTVVHDTAEMGAFPKTTVGEAASAASAVIQVMSTHAHANMRRDYFETILKLKLVQDEYSAQMLDIIVDGIRAPFEFVYINSYAYSPVSNSIRSNTNKVASTLQSGANGLQKTLDDLIETFDK